MNVGPLSERNKRRRKAEDANNLTEREVSFLGKDLRISERDLRKDLSQLDFQDCLFLQKSAKYLKVPTI